MTDINNLGQDESTKRAVKVDNRRRKQKREKRKTNDMIKDYLRVSTDR